MNNNDMAFFGSYYISKQITELVIDLIVLSYRSMAPGVTGVVTKLRQHWKGGFTNGK